MTTAILVRTNYMDDRLRAFVTRLVAESGHAVHIIADETRGPVDAHGFSKLVLNAEVSAAMKLHCPPDFGWRCGDYSLYLARSRLPDVNFFWLVEPDTRPNWQNYGELFGLFTAEQADFIAPHLREVQKDDFWYPTMRWRSPHVWRCLFGFVRISAAAADLCWQERTGCRRRPDARLMWANDETFVATTVAANGLVGKGLNEVHPGLCTTESFDFHRPKAGSDFDALDPDGLIYHPVLYDGMYRRKLESIASISGGRRLTFKQRNELTRLRILRGWHKIRAGRIPGRM